ncbi:hypothetical protein F2Q70_00020666 [Brassica cretica]|uniref:Uncharacterized protein n=1 Tax=Brassica cretica TaxID=69181 RepID=A0A8S9GP28_BRACR|nr:hypothetical protein F2Q70_00020666 [Brassica cretica]
MMVVSGSMMLPVSQAPSICTGGASSSNHKKFENSLSTEEEDLVPAMEDEVDGEKEKLIYGVFNIIVYVYGVGRRMEERMHEERCHSRAFHAEQPGRAAQRLFPQWNSRATALDR